MNDSLLSRQFRRWRLFVRICLVVGSVLLVGPRFLPEGLLSEPKSQVIIFIGLALIAATFVFYFSRANRCPRCRRSFSEAPGYKSWETNGLPLFNAIRSCPFCGINL